LRKNQEIFAIIEKLFAIKKLLFAFKGLYCKFLFFSAAQKAASFEAAFLFFPPTRP
jgi:hypothetical protein